MVTAPFVPVKGRKSAKPTVFTFSPDSYKEDKVVKVFNLTKTVRFVIPLENIKVVGNWTIEVSARSGSETPDVISGQLFVDIPAKEPLMLEAKEKPKEKNELVKSDEDKSDQTSPSKRSLDGESIESGSSEIEVAPKDVAEEEKDDSSLDKEVVDRLDTLREYLNKEIRIVRLSGKIVDEHRHNMKVVLAELTWGDYHAVLGAEVSVVFECGSAGSSGGAVTESHNRTVVLADNGANADVTANDGVYSAFFVYTGSKRCRARVVAVGSGHQRLADLGRVSTVERAPGVIFMRSAEESVPAFRRELVLESFDMSNSVVNSGQDNADLIPPARVIDLTLLKTSLSAQSVEMKFTPPGNDLDQLHSDKGSRVVPVQYDVRISSNMSELYSEFPSAFQLKPEHLIGDDFDSKLTSFKIAPVLKFKVPEDVWLSSSSKVFAVALRANDSANASPVSNVVIVALKDPPTTFVPVFIAALLLIAFILLSALFYVVRRAARKSATSQGKIYIHVPNLNKKRMSGKHGNRQNSQEIDLESLPKLTTTNQVCVDSY